MSEIIRCNTFEEVAEIVARDFLQEMNDAGSEIFEEMQRCYMWDTDDIKSEVYYILQNTNCELWDDGTQLELRNETMMWRTFSKLFRNKIKEFQDA